MYNWTTAEDKKPTNERSMYWVWSTNGNIEMAYLMKREQFGGINCWQDMSNNNFDMSGTHYSEIIKPSHP